MFKFILNIFKKDSIRNRVMQVVEARIKNAQEKFDRESLILDKNFKDEVFRLHDAKEAEKNKLATELTNEVLAK